MNSAAPLEQHKSKLEVLIEKELQLYLPRIQMGLEQILTNKTVIDLNDYFAKLKRELDAQSSEQTSDSWNAM